MLNTRYCRYNRSFISISSKNFYFVTKEEIEKKKEEKQTETMEKNKKVSSETKSDEYEKICYMCHRPESKAGKMISMHNAI